MTTGVLMTSLSETCTLDRTTLEFVIKCLREDWYALNDIEHTSESESPRDLGIRLGRKMQLIKTINALVKIRDANTCIRL